MHFINFNSLILVILKAIVELELGPISTKKDYFSFRWINFGFRIKLPSTSEIDEVIQKQHCSTTKPSLNLQIFDPLAADSLVLLANDSFILFFTPWSFLS